MTMLNLKRLLRRNKSVLAQARGEAVYLPGYIVPQALAQVWGVAVMPYKSAAQRGYFHTAAGRKAVGAKVVEDFDKESKGQRNLPKHVKPKRKAKR